jgi:hypothetical protein
MRPVGGAQSDGSSQLLSVTSEQSRQPRPKISLPSNDGRKPAASSRAAQEVLKSDARSLSIIANDLTNVSDPLAVSRAVLVPKRFDRVFNVVVDPDEFDVDESSTVKTEFGKRALEVLRARGDVVVVAKQSGGPAPVLERLRLRERDRSAGDMAFERYFVTIEPAFKEIR